jgi:hypothetical protein
MIEGYGLHCAHFLAARGEIGRGRVSGAARHQSNLPHSCFAESGW